MSTSIKVSLIYIYRLVCIVLPLVIIGISEKNKSFSLAEFDRLDKDRTIHSTFDDTNEPALPTGPLELMNVIRRATAMDEATSPSDALDDALKAFENNDEIHSTTPLD